MTSARDQVVLLTRGISLPLEPLRAIHLKIIADAICAAWREALAEVPQGLATNEESWINFDMIVRLTIALRGARRSPFATLVSEVHRGVEQPNFDGSAIEKRPDINFLLTSGIPGFPLIGECKIIDAAKGQTVGKYDLNGVRRFVDGRYAWFDAQAFMIAYVRDRTHVEPAIATLTGKPPSRQPTRFGRHVATTHDRQFDYIDRGPDIGVPGPITIIHVWLDTTVSPAPLPQTP